MKLKLANLLEVKKKPIVCIQGLGFVGLAMLIAITSRVNKNNKPYYNVIGIEKNNSNGNKIVNLLNAGKLPFKSSDQDLKKEFYKSFKRKSFFTSTDTNLIKYADIIISDINLDLKKKKNVEYVDFSNFKLAMKSIGANMKEDALVIVETTVPPGTSDKIAIPTIDYERNKRGFKKKLSYAFSYERVMPGDNYLNSIINFWRVYAGNNRISSSLCNKFLKKIINYKNYPITELPNLVSSESAKIIENSYRAINIAFINEWSRFSEKANVDLYSVIEAIKLRPTHNNIRYPGFGVGGYCLTKDPLFGKISSNQLFKFTDIKFPISQEAVEINNNMPLECIKILKKHFRILKNKKILILGLSYKEGTDDMRHSPSDFFAKNIIKLGVQVKGHDPLVKNWKNYKNKMISHISDLEKFDAIILAVAHSEYKRLSFSKIKFKKNVFILDANNVLTDQQINILKKKNISHKFIGRGLL